jgi:hypothetical protein
MGCRSMVGLPTLDRSIGVRIPAPQPVRGEADKPLLFLLSHLPCPGCCLHRTFLIRTRSNAQIGVFSLDSRDHYGI